MKNRNRDASKNEVGGKDVNASLRENENYIDLQQTRRWKGKITKKNKTAKSEKWRSSRVQ